MQNRKRRSGSTSQNHPTAAAQPQPLGSEEQSDERAFMNPQELTKSALRVIVVGIAISLSSCRYFTEPEPFSNRNAFLPVITPLSVSQYPPGDTVIGMMTIELHSAQNSYAIDFVTILNEDTSFASIYQSPYKFDVDTRWWPNGKHDITFRIVYRKDINTGLLRLVDTTSIQYSVPVEFIHPPFPPTISYTQRTCMANQIPCTPTSGIIESIYLTQRMRSDVSYYVFQRYFYSNDVNNGGTLEAITQDTIYSSSVSVFVDTVRWRSVYWYYKIGAGNEHGISYTNLFW